MNSRASFPPGRRFRRSHRWPLAGACLWVFLMTLLGAEVAGGESRDACPDEGYRQDEGRGRTEGRRRGGGL